VSDTWAGSRDSRTDVASWNKSLLNENNKEKKDCHPYTPLVRVKNIVRIRCTLKKWKTLFQPDRRCRRYAALCLISQKEHTGTCVRAIVVTVYIKYVHLTRNLEIRLFSLKYIVREPWLHWFVCPNTLFYRWICCRPHCTSRLKAVSCDALTFFLSKNIIYSIIRS
jgi:hypothetical protein